MPAEEKSNSRSIPVALRDAVLERDGHQCTFVAKYGTRCECRQDLEADHELPVAHGGETTLENLRTVCRAHNFLFARQIFGNEHVDEMIEMKRSGVRKEELHTMNNDRDLYECMYEGG